MGYSPWGRQESDTTERFHFISFFSLDKILQRREKCKKKQKTNKKNTTSEKPQLRHWNWVAIILAIDKTACVCVCVCVCV